MPFVLVNVEWYVVFLVSFDLPLIALVGRGTENHFGLRMRVNGR